MGFFKMGKPGRPKGTTGIPQKMTKNGIMAARKMAMQYAEEALQKLVEIMRDDTVDKAVQLKAANDVLNRAMGTPVSMTVVEQITRDENSAPTVSRAAIAAASTPELMALAEALARFTQKAEQENLIDVTPNLPDNYPNE